MERIVVFLDYANINRAADDKLFRMNYQHLLKYISEGRFLIDAHTYVPIDPRNEHRQDRDIEDLWLAGYIVNSKVGNITGSSYKCNFDIEMTMDILQIAYTVKPDIIVLATGDIDFIPVIQTLRRLGIRVEVASFEESASRELILKSQGFINLDNYYSVYISSSQNEHKQTLNNVQNEQNLEQENDLNKEENNINQSQKANHSDTEVI